MPIAPTSVFIFVKQDHLVRAESGKRSILPFSLDAIVFSQELEQLEYILRQVNNPHLA